MFTLTPEGQPSPMLHQEKSGQLKFCVQLWNPPAKEGHGAVEAGPEECHTDHSMAEARLL